MKLLEFVPQSGRILILDAGYVNLDSIRSALSRKILVLGSASSVIIPKEVREVAFSKLPVDKHRVFRLTMDGMKMVFYCKRLDTERQVLCLTNAVESNKELIPIPDDMPLGTTEDYSLLCQLSLPLVQVLATNAGVPIGNDVMTMVKGITRRYDTIENHPIPPTRSSTTLTRSRSITPQLIYTQEELVAKSKKELISLALEYKLKATSSDNHSSLVNLIVRHQNWSKSELAINQVKVEKIEKDCGIADHPILSETYRRNMNVIDHLDKAVGAITDTKFKVYGGVDSFFIYDTVYDALSNTHSVMAEHLHGSKNCPNSIIQTLSDILLGK